MWGRPSPREDYVQVRWAIAGCEEQPVLTPHALDGLSFPVTLAWETPRCAGWTCATARTGQGCVQL